jgi:hypothetical protein
MQDQILIEKSSGEFVMKANFDDHEFTLKFYGADGFKQSVDLYPDLLVPLRDFINKYLDQACFGEQFDIFPPVDYSDCE